MATANLGKKPTGFPTMDEGEHALFLKKVEGFPRTNVTKVAVEFVNAEGILLKNNYDLTNDGGYAAFYYLVTIGCEMDVDEKFDIGQIEHKFVTAEIVHKEGSRPRADGTLPIFANISKVTGPADPFYLEGVTDGFVEDEDLDDEDM